MKSKLIKLKGIVCLVFWWEKTDCFRSPSFLRGGDLTLQALFAGHELRIMIFFDDKFSWRTCQLTIFSDRPDPKWSGFWMHQYLTNQRWNVLYFERGTEVRCATTQSEPRLKQDQLGLIIHVTSYMSCKYLWYIQECKTLWQHYCMTTYWKEGEMLCVRIFVQ